MHVNPHRQFDTVARDIIGPFIPPSSKDNSYVLLCICLLSTFPFTMPIPNKLVETAIQAYIQHIYTAFGGSLRMIVDTGGSHLSRTVVKPDSHLAWIFFPKFGFLFPV